MNASRCVQPGAKHSPKRGRRLKRGVRARRQLMLERLENRIVLSRIAWDGGGDGFSWLDADNWDGNVLPGSSDQAVIEDSGLQVRIAGAVSIAGLEAASALIVDAGGSLTLTGPGVVEGQLTLSPGTTLTVTGAGSSLSAAASAFISGANVLAGNGGVITLPGALDYRHAGTGNSQHRTLRAEGTGSRLELPNLEGITGGTYYNNRVFIQANSGGVVDVSRVRQIADLYDGDMRHRSIDVLAEGGDSQVFLTSLTSYSDRSAYDFGDGRYSTLAVRAGGTVQIPNLTSAHGVNLELDATGTIQVAQFTRFTSGRVAMSGAARAFPALADASSTTFVVNGVHLDLPLLTSLRHGAMTLQSGGTASVPQLSDIDGASLYVYGGATLVVPGATSYSHAGTGNSQHRYLRAQDAGSRLELPNVTWIGGGSYYNNRLFIEGKAGGLVDLSNVQQIADPNDPLGGDTRLRSIDILAEGADSRVELQDLINFIDRYGASASGDARYSTIQERDGGQILTPMLTTTVGVHIERDAAGGESLGAQSDQSPEPASDGGAIGTSSDDPPLAPSWAGQTLHWIGDSGLWSDPANWSEGRVPSIEDDVIVDVDGVELTITIGTGNVQVRSLTCSENLTVASGASLAVAQPSMVSGTTTLAPGSGLRVFGATASFQATGPAIIDGANLHASAGGKIDLSTATSYAHAGTGNSQHRTLRAEGVGALIDLSQVTSITGGTHYNSRLFLQALSGGQLDLRNVASIMAPSEGDLRHRSIDVVADGVGSQIRLDALTEYTDKNAYDFGDGRYSTLTARGGGAYRRRT
jgi:hypothetical protein